MKRLLKVEINIKLRQLAIKVKQIKIIINYNKWNTNLKVKTMKNNLFFYNINANYLKNKLKLKNS